MGRYHTAIQYNTYYSNLGDSDNPLREWTKSPSRKSKGNNDFE